MGGFVVSRPDDESNDIIRVLTERADRAEREREELRKELKGIRGLLESVITEMRASSQRKTIASAVYDEGHDAALRDLGIPLEARRRRRNRGGSDRGHLKLVVPVWTITAGAGAAALYRSMAATAKAHPAAITALRQVVTAGHAARRHAVATAAVGVVGIGTLAGVTQVTLAPSVVPSQRPVAVSPESQDGSDAVLQPVPPGRHPTPAPSRPAHLAKHPKASPSPSVSPPQVVAAPASAPVTATQLPALQVPVATPTVAVPSPSLPVQAPGVPTPPVSPPPVPSTQSAQAPSVGSVAGRVVQGVVQGVVQTANGVTGSLAK